MSCFDSARTGESQDPVSQPPTTLQPLFQSQPWEPSSRPPSAPGTSQHGVLRFAPGSGSTTSPQTCQRDSPHPPGGGHPAVPRRVNTLPGLPHPPLSPPPGRGSAGRPAPPGLADAKPDDFSRRCETSAAAGLFPAVQQKPSQVEGRKAPDATRAPSGLERPLKPALYLRVWLPPAQAPVSQAARRTAAGGRR